jgi:hypothetical protein
VEPERDLDLGGELREGADRIEFLETGADVLRRVIVPVPLGIGSAKPLVGVAVLVCPELAHQREPALQPHR